MVAIISKEGYPKDNELFVRVDYFIKASPSEGGILIIGRDSQGKEYKSKKESQEKCSFSLPSRTHYSVAMGSNPKENHPAAYFPFELKCSLSSPEISAKADANEDFTDALDMKVMDESGKPISLDKDISNIFKFIASWAVLEIADTVRQGGVRNHFWGEMYIPKAPDIEKFLEVYRE